MSPSFLLAEIGLIILSVMVIALIGWVVHMEMRLRKFMRGKEAKDLESVLRDLISDHERVSSVSKALERSTAELRALLTDAVRGVSVVRFNALAGDTSGKQSFATAIVSEKGDGVVLSSLHARENARMYAKPLANFASEHELTEEEKQAIVQARKRYSAPAAAGAAGKK